MRAAPQQDGVLTTRRALSTSTSLVLPPPQQGHVLASRRALPTSISLVPPLRQQGHVLTNRRALSTSTCMVPPPPQQVYVFTSRRALPTSTYMFAHQLKGNACRAPMCSAPAASTASGRARAAETASRAPSSPRASLAYSCQEPQQRHRGNARRARMQNARWILRCINTHTWCPDPVFEVVRQVYHVRGGVIVV